LILDVFIEEVTGATWVVAAMGTSQKVTNLISGEFAVLPEHGPAFTKSGLGLPTKFSFQRHKIARMPYTSAWFDIPPERRARQANPKIGKLDQPYYEKRIQAAAAAVNAGQTLKDLENIAVGALPRVL
jgi:hypothetical protein